MPEHCKMSERWLRRWKMYNHNVLAELEDRLPGLLGGLAVLEFSGEPGITVFGDGLQSCKRRNVGYGRHRP